MRFQTIGFCALLIIGIGVVGIYKSEDLKKVSSYEAKEAKKSAIPQKTVQAFAIRRSVNKGDLVLSDSFELLPVTFNIDSEKKYITEADKDLLKSSVLIINHSLKAGEFISPDSLDRLESKGFTEVVISADSSSIENFIPGFYDVYWHFNNSGRDKNLNKLKIFSKNVFVRPIDDEDEFLKAHKSKGENLKPVVFSIKNDKVGQYLQADQLGYFKIVSVTQKNINLENYSTLEVGSSKEIQANDISSSYKYDVNFIK